jgi:hypothetical protein
MAKNKNLTKVSIAILLFAGLLGSSLNTRAYPAFLRQAAKFGAKNCTFCHTQPAGGEGWNDRGNWLIKEKERRSADAIDVAWLAEYKEGEKKDVVADDKTKTDDKPETDAKTEKTDAEKTDAEKTDAEKVEKDEKGHHGEHKSGPDPSGKKEEVKSGDAKSEEHHGEHEQEESKKEDLKKKESNKGSKNKGKGSSNKGPGKQEPEKKGDPHP